MAAYCVQRGPAIPVAQQSQERDWVVRSSTPNVHSRRDLNPGTYQTKLLFNEAIPASPINRATRVGPPAPIVIERLLPPSGQSENVDSARSSISFTSLSEERLQAAIKLAKRDLRRRHLESVINSPNKPSQEASLYETSDVELLQDLAATPSKPKLKASRPKHKSTRPGTKLLVHTSQKPCISPMPQTGQSPPTKDPGLRQPKSIQHAPLSQEILKLQNELEVYIQKVEELANRGGEKEEPLEPEEQNKLEIRRQKQVARSACVIYVLQQQVKEIQEDIGKLQNLKMWDTKKDTTIKRLAAAHRGTLRALQVFIHQLSDLSHSKVPPHYKELGQLIRQLSLCCAKLEVEQGSAVPKIALDILQKIETLDSALSKQEMAEKMQAQACPPRRKSPNPSMSHTNAPKGPRTSVQGPCKASNPRRGVRSRRMAPHKPKSTSHQLIIRREGLRTNLQSHVQQRGLAEQQKLSQTSTTSRRGLHSGQRKTNTVIKRNQLQDAGFQQPTVSSQLRVNQLPQKEHVVPWMPTSPHSPPPQRSPQRGRQEPRCLFPPTKLSLSPQRQKRSSGAGAEPTLSSEKKTQTQNEAIRKAWLDKVMMQRLKALNQLTKEETERIQRLRSEVVSPTQWAERAEQKARERIQSLVDKAQQIGESRNRISPSLRNQLSEQAAENAAKSVEKLSEALLEDLLEDTALATWAAETDRHVEDVARSRLQAPTLESMLLRMSEIERDQEEVRRRFASITYSDPLFWDRPGAAGPQCIAPGSRPASPQPIRLTRPVMKPTSAADIVLEKPVETGVLSESSLTEEGSQEGQQLRSSAVFPGPAERSRGTVISVPGSTLRNIRRYREDYGAYLHVVAHETVGSFNPWAISESLAEELLSEAVVDVAAEFQDIVEEYAEAVFTSEFLQPVQSPAASPAAMVIQ
ncbi:hypothetical protein Q5P01_010448 [Channa striata]|uniref:Protein moonraker n=1 Tax=Channa striata TaxID=64152 RepID=A0AA88SRT1_CHASR|nr:hypothetical protein Q5P01_010448 [Channa striata]